MKHRFFIFSLFIVYMVATTAAMIWQGIGISPDRYALVLLLGSLLVKKTRSFILDWVPFIFILISYDFLRGLAYNSNSTVHFSQAIQVDQLIFNSIPTIELQKVFLNTSYLSWYDFLATIIYFLHFALPLSFAFLLWLKNRRYFREFVTGISVLSYAAWFTYLLFPTAPPWLANNQGYLTGVTKIMDLTLQAFPIKVSLPTIYHNINPNPVAAIPSLHAAYPFIIFLFSWRFFKLKALLFLPYVFSVWIAIVYLGEHYVTDVLIGIFYALFFYLFSVQILHNINWHKLFCKLDEKKYIPNIIVSKLTGK